MEYILRTNTVSKKYTNYYAVDKVSISIKKGEIYGLIGENGAGKSTLMKMIAGLVEPSEGSIELFGNFVPQTERYRIGCVIESPALYAELTAKQNLEVFRKAYGLSSKESVQQILKQVGLSQYENKIVKKFSLGMKQRLAIGIALLGNPDFLILDEPINGLDPTGIQDMRNFLLKLNREEHITIMISSHILGELSKIATKYGIIKNGKLIEEITAKELNEKCQCCLKIKASDTAQAAILIEKNLHTKNYEILSDNNIRIFEYVDNPGIVNSLLVNHGISVDECTVTKESLEDYFNPRPFDEALAVVGAAVRPQAVLTRARHHRPKRIVFGHLRQFGAVARLRDLREAHDLPELRVGIALRERHPVLGDVHQALEAHVVGAAFEHRGLGVHAQSAREHRHVLLVELVLQRLPARRNDDGEARQECGRQVREGLPRAGAGLSHERPFLLKRLGQGEREAQLASSRAKAREGLREGAVFGEGGGDAFGQRGRRVEESRITRHQKNSERL